MTGMFASIGSMVGWAVWRYARPTGPAAGAGGSGAASPDVAAILALGEGEGVEFKASVRWDVRLGRVNRALEEAVVHTVAGFLNHAGGTLLIGVSDAGAVVGLQPDYPSLRRGPVLRADRQCDPRAGCPGGGRPRRGPRRRRGRARARPDLTAMEEGP